MPTLRHALCGLLVVGSLVVSRAAANEQMASRLRQAVRLAPVSLEMGFRFDFASAMEMQNSLRPTAEEISRVRRELTGEPSDAPKQLRLAQLYSTLGETNQARGAVDKALELARRRAALQPDDGPALATLGEALRRAGKDEEAEAVLRDATRKSPDTWAAWVQLGSLLGSRAQVALFGDDSQQSVAWLQLLQGRRPTSATLEKARRLMDEAGPCFDRAVTLAPKEVEVFMARASFCASRKVVDLATQLARGELAQEQLSPFSVLSTNALPDLEAATRLAPRNYHLRLVLFWVITVQGWPAGISSPEAMEFRRLPEGIQKSAREQLTALERLGDDSDPLVAGGALSTLGGLQLFLLQDVAGARRTLRRAVALAPLNSEAWEMLVASFVQAGQWAELEPIAREWLRFRDDARGRLILAKAVAQQRQPERAETVLQEALAKFPEELNLQLSLSAVRLMSLRTEAELELIIGAINATGEVMKGRSVDEQRRLGPFLISTWSIAAALAGHLDEARQQISGLRKAVPEDAYGREIDGILGP